MLRNQILRDSWQVSWWWHLLRLFETFAAHWYLLFQEGTRRGSFSAEDAASLVREFQSGKQQAFEDLVALIRNDLWNFLVNQRLQVSDAEDLFQDILMKLFQKLKDLQEPDRFRSWLFAIALNQLRSRFRKREPSSLDQLSEQGLNPVSAVVDANRALMGKERIVGLRKVLADLPERELQLILLDRFGGLQQGELAELFDLNLNTVKTLLRRTRIQIVKAMKEAGYV